MKISNKEINANSPTFIIAEAGVNHNGDISIAKKMIDVAKEAKVDAIKFQTYKTKKLILEDTPKADYQIDIKNPNENFYEMLKKLELTYEEFAKLKEYCEKKDIIFLSTPFDYDSVELLEKINVEAYKIGSGDMDNYPLIKQVIRKKKPLMLSTGMSSLEEVAEVVKFIREEGCKDVILFQCTSLYPTPFSQVNLHVIKTYISKFHDLIIGFSDHSPGILTGALAVSLGAKVVEKHFTLDQDMKGPDHKASLNPKELKLYVQNIRNTEAALGSSEKLILKAEIPIKIVARKSLILVNEKKKGELLMPEDIAIKRPGTGISPKFYDHFIGKKISRNISKKSFLKWEDILN